MPTPYCEHGRALLGIEIFAPSFGQPALSGTVKVIGVDEVS